MSLLENKNLQNVYGFQPFFKVGGKKPQQQQTASGYSGVCGLGWKLICFYLIFPPDISLYNQVWTAPTGGHLQGSGGERDAGSPSGLGELTDPSHNTFIFCFSTAT